MAPTLRRFLSAPRYRIALLSASLAAAHVLGVAPAAAQPKGGAAAAAAPKGGAASPTEANVKKALELFKKGQGLYKANKFADALVPFRESYALVPSPNSRFYIARCLAGTNDNVNAHIEFEAVIADIDARNEDKYKETHDVAVQELAQVDAKIALLTVSVANAAENTRVSVAGKDIPREDWGKDIPREDWGKPLPVSPGAVEVMLTTPPAPSTTERLDLRAGEKRPLALDAAPAGGLPPPPPPGGSTGSRKFLRPVAYVAGGVGVVGFGVFGVFGAMAADSFAKLEKACPKSGMTRVCSTDTKKQIDDGKLQKDVANIGLVVGAVGLAAGVTLFILSRDTSPKKDEAPQVQAVIGPTYLGLQGSF
jgi:hypothetical protein